MVLSAVLLAGCGGGGGDSKELFSAWKRDSDGVVLDLSSAEFGNPKWFAFYFQNGAQCNCVLNVLGQQDSGTFVRNQCYYVARSASSDPGCQVLNGTANYTNIKAVLTINGPEGPVTFH